VCLSGCARKSYRKRGTTILFKVERRSPPRSETERYWVKKNKSRHDPHDTSANTHHVSVVKEILKKEGNEHVCVLVIETLRRKEYYFFIVVFVFTKKEGEVGVCKCVCVFVLRKPSGGRKE
jgi:hypothetical protein